jgi:electron transfer flavoprotein alpha subunit
MSILIVAEHDNHQLKLPTLHAWIASKKLSEKCLTPQTVDMLILGFNCYSVAKQAAMLSQIQTVFYTDHPIYEHQLAENSAKLIAKYAAQYDYVVMGSSTDSKNVLPRAAALLDSSLVSDVVEIIDEKTFVRPMYAGNVLATIESSEAIKFLTIRTTAFPLNNIADEKIAGVIKKIDDIIENPHTVFVSEQLTQSTRPSLGSARVIISGGRGLKSAENFKLLEKIADYLGAAIGASRAAVDAGYVPNDYQIGQTGKIVSPDLYIAIGISGAIQHLAGMKDSKVIVAINNDPAAPIFETADYYLVGDLFKILPEFEQALGTSEFTTD